MAAWLQCDAGRYYLRVQRGQNRTCRAVGADPEHAQAELTKARADLGARPWANGYRRWRGEWDTAEFAALPGKTRVSRQNYVLARCAMGVLAADPATFGFLLDPPRVTILGALGRLDPQTMVLAAAEICARRMRTKAAVQALRKFRGVERPSRAGSLGDLIFKTVLARFPNATPADVLNHLQALVIDFRDRERKAQNE